MSDQMRDDSDFWFCPVCGDEMEERASEDGDAVYVCPGCGYVEDF